VADPLQRTQSVGYDQDGNVTSTTDARGVVSTAAYDGRGLASGTSYSDGTPTVGFTYDAAGQPKTVTDAMGKRTYGYDAANQLTSITPDTGKGKPRGLAALPVCVDVRTAGPAATRADGH